MRRNDLLKAQGVKPSALVEYSQHGPGPVEILITAPRLAEHARDYIKHKRGKIGQYTSASKTRFRRQIWKLSDCFFGSEPPYSRKPIFFTLTLPGDGIDWWDIDTQRVFKAFRMAFQRRFPNALGYWAREFQKRYALHWQGAVQLHDEEEASLVGAPQCYSPRVEQLHDPQTGQTWSETIKVPLHPMQSWLYEIWDRILGHPYAGTPMAMHGFELIVEAETVRDPASVYLAKESSKNLQKDRHDEMIEFYASHGAEPPSGRWWGIFNRAAVQARQYEHRMPIDQAIADELIQRRDAYWERALRKKAERFGWTEVHVPTWWNHKPT